MKRIFVFITAIILSNVLGYAQNITVSDDKTIGGNQDEYNGFLMDFNNQFFLLEMPTGSSQNFGDRTVTKKGIEDAWIVKVNKQDLSLSTQYSIGGSANDILFMYKINNNSFILFGNSFSPISLDKTTPLKNNNGDLWLLNVDSNMNINWQVDYSANITPVGMSFYKFSENEYFLLNISNAGIGIDKTDTSRGGNDIWIIKTDSSGNKIWDKTYGGTNQDIISGAFKDDMDFLYVFARSNSTSGADKTDTLIGGNNYGDIWLLKLDSAGNKIWDKTYGTTDDENTSSFIYFNGYIYAAISTTSAVSGNKTVAGYGNTDIWLFKINPSNGNIISQSSIGGSNFDQGFIYIKNNRLYIVATSNSNISGVKTENTKGGADYWILEIDTNLNILWQKDIGSSGDELVNNIYPDNSNNYIITGASNANISGDKTENSRGGYDIWLVKLNVTTGIKEYNKNHLFVYPNPSEEYIQLDFDTNLPASAELIITNMLGQTVYSQNNLKKYNQIKINDFPAGNYIINISNNNQIMFTTKFVKK